MTDYLYVTEYADPPIRHGSMIAAGAEPSIAVQKVAIAGASASGVKFNAETKFVRLHCTAVCSVAFGLTATVTVDASGTRYAANQTEFVVLLAPGTDQSFAVIANT